MRFYWDLGPEHRLPALMANFLTKLKLFQGLIMGRQSSFSKDLFGRAVQSHLYFLTLTGVHLDNVINTWPSAPWRRGSSGTSGDATTIGGPPVFL